MKVKEAETKSKEILEVFIFPGSLFKLLQHLTLYNVTKIEMTVQPHT